MTTTLKNNHQTYVEGNDYKKISRNISFAYKSGYEALEWLEECKDELKGGKSAYIVKLLLEDKARKARKKR